MTDEEPTPADDAGNEPIRLDEAPPAADESLRLRAEAAERERDDYLRMLKEKQAEFENYQKRASAARDQERRFAAQPLALELLTPLDTLDMAIQEAENSSPGSATAEGLKATKRQFLDALKRSGVAPVEAEGVPFDPNCHQAVSQQPTADVEPGTVVTVFRGGFMMHERVLRPASVVVAVAPPEPSEGE